MTHPPRGLRELTQLAQVGPAPCYAKKLPREAHELLGQGTLGTPFRSPQRPNPRLGECSASQNISPGLSYSSVKPLSGLKYPQNTTNTDESLTEQHTPHCAGDP